MAKSRRGIGLVSKGTPCRKGYVRINKRIEGMGTRLFCKMGKAMRKKKG